MTLAYLFWHWPQPVIRAAEYELRQSAFHSALAQAPSPGFRSSSSFSIAGAPWASAGGAAYEDWYLVEDFAALGALNDAAVSASRRLPHDAAAAFAASGAGGLYRLRLGERVADPGWAYWLSKPDGMRYDELWELLAPIAAAGSAVWLRQMVLGPARELCLHSAHKLDLSDALQPLRLALRRTWPRE